MAVTRTERVVLGGYFHYALIITGYQERLLSQLETVDEIFPTDDYMAGPETIGVLLDGSITMARGSADPVVVNELTTLLRGASSNGLLFKFDDEGVGLYALLRNWDAFKQLDYCGCSDCLIDIEVITLSEGQRVARFNVDAESGQASIAMKNIT